MGSAQARKLGETERNIFVGILGNAMFLVITLGEFGAQVLISQYGGAVFKVTGGLTGTEWGICFALGAGELPFHFLATCVPASCFKCLMGKDEEPEAAPEDVEAGTTPMQPTRSRARTGTIGGLGTSVTKGFEKMERTGSKFGAQAKPSNSRLDKCPGAGRQSLICAVYRCAGVSQDGQVQKRASIKRLSSNPAHAGSLK